jgi:hypothetical protein
VKDSRDREAGVDRWLRHASAGAPDVPATDACLDPEVMAAWVEGRLTGTAFASAEAHVAGCARCQAIVGTLIRTASIAEWAAPERRSPWRWLTWAVPLTAAATIVSVVLVEWRPRSQPVQTQAGTEAPPPVADLRQAEPAPASAASPATKPELRDEAGRAAPAQEKRLAARGAAENERSGARADKQNPASTLAQAPAGPAAASKRAAEPKQEQKPAAPPARAEELDRLSSLSRAKEGTVLEVRSPASAVRWRVLGGRIQRTVDAGSTWTDVPAGAAVDITAGAAPDASVCWLVGRRGVVLLTTDGSAWQRVPLPEATDLSGVRATDGRNATVTTVDGREFATTDGGRTWVRRDLQETRTAPF